MFTRSWSRLVVLFVAAILTSATVFSQTHGKVSKHRKGAMSKEVVLEAESDGPSRKTPGASEPERERGRKFATPTRDKGQKGQDGDKKPEITKLTKAGSSFNGDLRSLPFETPVKMERPEREEPLITPRLAGPPPSGNEK